MKKLVPAALLVAGLSASLLVGATSVSWAQETGPASQACTDAKAAEVPLASELNTAVFEERTLEEKALKEAKDSANLATLEGAVNTAQVDLDENVKNFPNNAGLIEDRKRVLAAAKATLAAAEKTISDAEAALKAEGSATAGVRARLELAKAATEKACAEPGVEPYADCDEAEAANDVPVLVSNPRYNLALDSDADGIGCEVNEDDGADNGGNDNGSDNNGNGSSDANDTGSNASSNDNGLNPGPIVPSVFTPVGGVETGGGPA